MRCGSGTARTVLGPVLLLAWAHLLVPVLFSVRPGFWGELQIPSSFVLRVWFSMAIFHLSPNDKVVHGRVSAVAARAPALPFPEGEGPKKDERPEVVSCSLRRLNPQRSRDKFTALWAPVEHTH